ncbi:MAG: DUF4835 family protein [bacterium]|nr:DUF4835 family protein [bacterium]
MCIKNVITNFRNTLLLGVLICFNSLNAQDIDATITVIHPTVQISNTQIFESLKGSISQFINQRLWCADKITNIERFKMNILIDIKNYELNSNNFSGTIQIQATRPVYGSTYSTVLFNQLDEELDFQYQEFQAMEYQVGSNVYNLTGVLAFYVNVVLGMNYDSYALNAGTNYFQKSREILNASQALNGWRPSDGKSLKNRFYLIDNLMSERYKPLRKAFFDYHLNGLDLMHKDVTKGRDAIFKSLEDFQELARIFPNSMLVKVFFNAKYKELIEIFKEAPTAEQNKAVDLLSRMDPANKLFYDKIKG